MQKQSKTHRKSIQFAILLQLFISVGHCAIPSVYDLFLITMDRRHKGSENPEWNWFRMHFLLVEKGTRGTNKEVLIIFVTVLLYPLWSGWCEV